MCAGKEEGIALTTLSLSHPPFFQQAQLPSWSLQFLLEEQSPGNCVLYWHGPLANKTSISEPAPSPSSRASLCQMLDNVCAAEEMLARGLPVQHGVPELEHSLPGGCSYICVTNCYMAAKMHTHLLLTNRRRGTRALSRGPVHMEIIAPLFYMLL